MWGELQDDLIVGAIIFAVYILIYIFTKGEDRAGLRVVLAVMVVGAPVILVVKYVPEWLGWW
jgi:hypothetical protein